MEEIINKIIEKSKEALTSKETIISFIFGLLLGLFINRKHGNERDI